MNIASIIQIKKKKLIWIGQGALMERNTSNGLRVIYRDEISSWYCVYLMHLTNAQQHTKNVVS